MSATRVETRATLTVRRVSNPLAGISFKELMRDVELFAVEKDLTEHLDLLKTGALVAQDPANFENVDSLSEDERAEYEQIAEEWKQDGTPMEIRME